VERQLQEELFRRMARTKEGIFIVVQNLEKNSVNSSIGVTNLCRIIGPFLKILMEGPRVGKKLIATVVNLQQREQFRKMDRTKGGSSIVAVKIGSRNAGSSAGQMKNKVVEVEGVLLLQ